MGLTWGDEVTFSINGVDMGTFQTADLTTEYVPERQFENGNNLTLYNKEYTIICENIQFSKDFFEVVCPLDKRYKVVGTGFKYPRGNKLPKKKRIRNKWIKKCHHVITLNNCVIL